MLAPPATTVVRSPFLVRVAGLPAATVTALASPTLRAVVRNTLDAERAVATDGAELADALYPVIGGLSGAAYRPALVGLRRALFQGRPPRPAEWTPVLRRALPGTLAARIDAWLVRLAFRDALTGAVARTLAAETGTATAALLRAAADPVLRHGLVLSSPALSAEVEKWLADPARRPARQTVLRLARYVSRAATKTSPYSTFTTIGAGVFTDADAPRLALAALPAPRGLLEVHGPVLAELATVLAASPDLRAALVVRVNPSLTRVGDRLVVLGPPPGERIASVAALPGVLSCVAALGDGWQRLDRLRARLAGGVAPVARIDAFVDRLVEAGVLERRLPVEDQCRDWFGALGEWLRGAGGDRWAGTAAACARVSELAGPPADVTDVDGHRTRLAGVRRAVADLRTEAGLGDDPTGGSVLVHEHTVYPRPVATAGRRRWDGALADLDRVHRFLAVHDSALPLRVALGGYAGTRFGPGSRVPFVVFYHRILADLDGHRPDGADPVLADLATELTPHTDPPTYRTPALRDLATRRDQGLRALLGTPPDADGVVRIDPDRLAAYAGDALDRLDPDRAASVRSVAWFVQPDGDRLVLNAAMSGHGRGQGRSLHLITQAGGDLPAGAGPDPAPGTGIVADSSGAFGHTLNLRLNRGGYELDYPYTVRLTESRPTVALGDLVVAHDPGTGLVFLRDARDGTAVTPAHLGMVVQTGLPRALQLLTRGLGANPGWLYRPTDLPAAPPPGPDGVGFAPRVETGSVVLRRAAWTAPAHAVPRRAPGEPEAGALLRLYRWLTAHGVPDRCFVTATGGPDGPAGKARKPLYVDFASPLLVAMCEQMLAGAAGVTFHEALPAVTERGHVTELVVETEAVW